MAGTKNFFKTVDDATGKEVLSEACTTATPGVSQIIATDPATGKIDPSLIEVTLTPAEIFSGSDDTGGLNINAGWVDLPLNIENKKTSGFTHAASSAEVTVVDAGTYVFNGYVSTDMISGTNSNAEARLMVDTGGGYVEVPGTRIRMSSDSDGSDDKNTGAFSITLDVVAGASYKLQVQRSDGTGTMETVASSGLNIFTVGANGAAGPQGPQGPAGSGTTIVLEDEGIPVANTPHQTLNFIGDNVTVTDAGAGQADITVSAPVFGTEYQNATSSGVTTTTSITFVQKLRLTTTSLPAGDYIVLWSSTMGGVDSDKEFSAKFEQDDAVVLGEWDMKPKQGSLGLGPNASFSGHRIVTLSGVHTFDIDFRSSGDEARIQDASITLWRVA